MGSRRSASSAARVLRPSAQALASLVSNGAKLGYKIPELQEGSAFNFVTYSNQIPVGFSIALREDTQRIHVHAIVRAKYLIEHPRTDMNNVTTTAFALMVRATVGASVGWVYDEGFCEGEIDDGFLFLEQPESSLPGNDQGIKVLTSLLRAAFMTSRALAECEDPDHRATGISDESRCSESSEWAQVMMRALGRDLESILYAHRLCPAWMSWYDSADNTSFLHAPKFVSRIRSLLATAPQLRTVDGIRGKLYVGEQCRYFVSDHDLKQAYAIIAAAHDGATLAQFLPVPFENWLVGLGLTHAVWLPSECGRFAFDAERERVHVRHQLESELLFPPSRFIWANVIPDDKFEDLIGELLAREPGVTNVRKSGPTHQADKGRDLIVERVISSRSAQEVESAAELEVTSIVAQVKAMKGRVGKGVVRDIRDTVEHHRARGFFLAVASELTTGLIEVLETLRRERGWFVEWWTRVDIEKRLRRHTDIAARYGSVVRPKISGRDRDGPSSM